MIVEGIVLRIQASVNKLWIMNFPPPSNTRSIDRKQAAVTPAAVTYGGATTGGRRRLLAVMVDDRCKRENVKIRVG